MLTDTEATLAHGLLHGPLTAIRKIVRHAKATLVDLADAHMTAESIETDYSEAHPTER